MRKLSIGAPEFALCLCAFAPPFQPRMCPQARRWFACGSMRRSLTLLAALGLFLSTILESHAAGMREVWVAIRDDGKLGAGTLSDPFSGGTVKKLNGLFEKFRNEYRDNLTIHFGPGVYEGDQQSAVAWYNNLDLLGQAMKNVRGQPIIGRMPENPEPRL